MATGNVDADEIARDWLPYCLAWARRMERLHPNPMGRYYDAAVDGLRAAIRTSDNPGGALGIEHLQRCLRTKGIDHTAKDRRRAAKLSAVPLDSHVLARLPEALKGVDDRDTWDALKVRLEPRERDAMERHYLMGQTDREIARDMGIRRESVKVIRQRAIRKLRKGG